ncbi:metallophosphoesterase family protein [Natrialbaceae archaeon AArc-T1-2]|uniref:metallophosphoesterase family protein n=1 Tax=Natrialbaceae archaeon AArc-T1-2 TaxID=3053904 RepID=UPI00255B35A4|nr:metallophosphoesterase family protein [Natrialbaceae archaeon AArc-T1-2]WIV66601.1 metallophosphoesterase family protein [Natrialbaceae archaeon AArc-T1-2]
MPRVAILGDTHVPSRADEIPAWVATEIERADHAIHTDDFDSPAAYERIDALADGDLTAARGNMDPASLGLPTATTLEAGDVTFVVTHGTGDPAGWYDRVVATVHEQAGPDAIGVAGHTHEVVDETVDGVRICNPGSATAASPADRETIFVADVAGGDVELELRTG